MSRPLNQSGQPLQPIRHQSSVRLAKRAGVCRPMTECCGEVIMLVAISLAKQEE
ncbi:hypothetical protein ABVT39_004876 [Epinephelus coioides]